MSRFLLLCAMLCLAAGAALCIYATIRYAHSPAVHYCHGTDDEPAGCP